jgi:hypothetical protein
MSDPATTIRQISEQEFETLRGRLAAMEILLAQAWVAVLKHVPDEDRDEFVEDALIQQENRFHRLHPVAQRVALERAEAILGSALVTVRQVPEEPLV